MKQNESVKKLEIGKDYVHVNDLNTTVIDRCGDYPNKGFYGARYQSNFSCYYIPKTWREATEEEVIEAFRKHLVYRYGKDWRTMKIKERHPDSTLPINDGSWTVGIYKTYDGWNVCNKNGAIYRNGVWVERLEEKELEKIHIKEAIKENTVIHCETEEEAERILNMAHEFGYGWLSGKSFKDFNKWDEYRSVTCYNIILGSYESYRFFKNRNYTIIPSTQIADLRTKSTDWTPAPEDIEESNADGENNQMEQYRIVKTAGQVMDEINQMNDGSIMEIYKVQGGFKTKFQSGWTPAPEDIESMNKKAIEKLPIDKVTTKNLDIALRMVGIQLDVNIIDKVIDLVELIENNGDDVTIKDIVSLQQTWSRHSQAFKGD